MSTNGGFDYPTFVTDELFDSYAAGTEATDQVLSNQLEDNGGTINVKDINKISTKDTQDDKPSSASFGPVASPFFFMCHYPRVGEALAVGEDEVTLQVQFTNNETVTRGYEPHAVYEG